MNYFTSALSLFFVESITLWYWQNVRHRPCIWN